MHYGQDASWNFYGVRVQNVKNCLCFSHWPWWWRHRLPTSNQQNSPSDALGFSQHAVFTLQSRCK